MAFSIKRIVGDDMFYLHAGNTSYPTNGRLAVNTVWWTPTRSKAKQYGTRDDVNHLIKTFKWPNSKVIEI